MLFIELLSSNAMVSELTKNEISRSIHKFFMDTFLDIEYTKNIFILFSDKSLSSVCFESREKYKKGNESHVNLVLVRISGVPDFNKMIYREFKKSAVNGDFKNLLETHIKGVLQKDRIQECCFFYV